MNADLYVHKTVQACRQGLFLGTLPNHEGLPYKTELISFFGNRKVLYIVASLI
jgi:hypothetical protein